MRCETAESRRIEQLLRRYGLTSIEVAPGATIPGSYWGAPEAGLIADAVYWRPDTPLHSLLHELSHYVCMDRERRDRLDTDAGGDDLEECAVCYLEVVLACYLAPFDSARCLEDMDAWGYSFREGSAIAWIAGDGQDARSWLLSRQLVHADDTPTWRLREA